MHSRAQSRRLHRGVAHESFLSGILINHGPADVIGRLLLQADTAARQRGVLLSFAPMQQLVDINHAHRDTWRPLLPVFNPQCGLFDAGSAFCIVGRDHVGDIVLTQAARAFSWQGTSFHEEATSLRLFYRQPAAQCRTDEAAEVTAPSARSITGRVAFTGAHWCRPDFRAKGLSAITPRIARALALAWWDVEFTCTIMATEVLSRGVAQRADMATWSGAFT